MEYNDDNATKSELNPFFYGVTLVHKPKSYTYQADALSANTQLDKTFYEEQHVYRVEWEPAQEDGTGGYIRWYTDGAFVYSIHGDSLNITGAEIPREAMYLLMNTAVAGSWGFPAPCPSGCTCECFECGNPDCECALPTGYCDNFPGNFEIDYVRVYQAVDEPKHTVGCSPEARPTALYIEGHKEKYMEEGDKRPLKPVSNGGAACLHDKDCGGKEHGRCSPKGYCVCNATFTGPTCLAHAGFYDFESRDVSPSDVGCKFHLLEVSHPQNCRLLMFLTLFPGSTIYMPRSLIIIILSIFVGFLLSMADAVKNRMKIRRYRKVPSSAAAGRHSANHQQTNTNSYQNSSDYALPPKQKVVTYCVIDGRLVDQSSMPAGGQQQQS
jgi:hypothetical protein